MSHGRGAISISLCIFVLVLSIPQFCLLWAGSAVLVGNAGACGPEIWLAPRCRCLTAFVPCPLQRRNREQRWAGTLAAYRQRAWTEGKTAASLWSQMKLPARRFSPWPHGWAQRNSPVPHPRWGPQKVTWSLLRGFPGHPVPPPPHATPTARGMPWGGQPTLPALGHLGTG